MGKKICVIGLGYVGLPLACILAKRGYSVLGIDVNKKNVESLNRGIATFSEKGLDSLLKEVVSCKKLTVTDDYEKAKGQSKFVICVPTPVDKNGRADLNYLYSACENLAEHTKKNGLVIVESSIPPGTMETVAGLLETKSKLQVGKDVYLAHCPERIFPENVLYEIENNDRIVAGFDEKSTELAVKVYKSFTKGKILTTDLATAQLVKLVENVYRDINIAAANELALICEKLNVDVKEVIRLANTHPRVKYLNPGCGVGGSCIPKDPVILTGLLKDRGLETKLIRAARDVNTFMEFHFSKEIIGNIKGRDVLILGLAYKGNVGDTRDSPAENIIDQLKKAGLNVLAHDPWVNEISGIEMVKDLKKLNTKFDALVLVTDHDVFKNMNLSVLEKITKRNALVADGRRIFDKNKIENMGLRYIGIGI
jgi:UDP-N-acetyl-D-mannosaminuronic acid dehydrogenase